LKILSLHNAYRQRGGEDVVVEQEVQLLREHGHEVIEYRRSNEELGDDLVSKFRFGQGALWSRKAALEIEAIIYRSRPDVAHFHNTFPLISPSGYWICKRLGLPVVQTVHNYRMICVRGDYFRDGHICEDCLRWKTPLPAMVHRCYRGSMPQTMAAAGTLAVHRLLGTWTKLVDVFVALSAFCEMKLIEAGIPPDKIFVKPNFVHPDPGPRGDVPTDYALFAGRFSPEKRVLTLVGAWEKIDRISLLIVGDGPCKEDLGRIIGRGSFSNVRMVGPARRKELLELMKRATFLLVPSEWYETFGMVIVEAFACGVPVLASRLGAMAELIEDRKTGLLFSPGSVDEIRGTVEWALDHPQELRQIAANARKIFEAKYTAEINYPMMIRAYERALHSAPISSRRTGVLRDVQA
jgi:glycosyltransferase involved in cell wall biosynthesis